MYTFRKVSDRMLHLHQRIRDRVIRFDSERARIITESDKKWGMAIPHIRRAKKFYDICDQMTLRVEDEDVLVGNLTRYFCGSSTSPDYSGMGWVPNMVTKGLWTKREDGLYHNPDSDGIPMCISEEDYQELLKVGEYWKGRTYSDITNTWFPDDYRELARLGVGHALHGSFLSIAGVTGHTTPGYKKILSQGFGAIRKVAQDWLDENRLTLDGDKTDKMIFYSAVVIVCDGAERLIRRYGDACREKAAETTDEKRKAELLSMADSLDWISVNPARTFYEACQLEFLYLQMLILCNIGSIGSCGRFDQITGPYLEKDLAEGRITLDEAQEIVDNFFLNVSRNWGGTPPSSVSILGMGNTYMHTTVGGTDPITGKDATNTVTYMVLETMARLGKHDPTITLRMTKDTPDSLMECAIETTKRCGGIPLYYNDDVVIPAVKKELGMTLEDARDYALIGCQEITGSGNENAQCNGIVPPNGTVFYSVCLDMAINDGKNPYNGEQCEIHTGYLYDMKSIEEVKEAYLKIADYVMQRMINVNCFGEYVIAKFTPHVILSISIEGCMESGKDISEGGAKYNHFGGTGTGLATVADSFSAIEYACFDKKICTTREMYDAVMANWEGYEDLQQQLIRDVPHFGNNNPYADKWMRFATHSYYDMCQQYKSKYCDYYRAGLYGAADHVHQGYVTWATPDGRKAGAPLADAASPGPGRDTNGPTAVLNSSTCYDHSKFMDGVCLNLRFHPKALEREDGNQKLATMIKAYMAQGGAEVQFNIVSVHTMRKAQEDPNDYKDLVVRIAGYSAYFVELTEDCQNSLIERTENVAL